MNKIFAVGDVNVDLFTHAQALAEFGTESHVQKFYCTLGGNAANFAATCGVLGLRTNLISAIGDDIFTPFILRELKKFNVNPLLEKSAMQNGVSNIFVRRDGERAIVSSKGCLLTLDSNAISKKLLPGISAGDIVFFGGFFHLIKLRKGFAALLSAIRHKKAVVVFDACYDEYGLWKVRDFLKFVDIFILNELELAKITRAKTAKRGIARLFSMGANMVVLKRGKNGADFYHPIARKEPIHSAAFSVKAFNATGAGDFFNAGFAYGLLRTFSALNCLRCGNFVASRKVASSEYMPELRGSLKEYLARSNLSEIMVKGSTSEMAKEAVKHVVFLLDKLPNATISFASGKTTVPIYRALVKAYHNHEVDFSRCTFIGLDEYLGLENIKDSFAHSLRKNFLDKVNFRRENIFLFNSRAKKPQAECRRLEFVVRRKGLHFVLLGIGENAHIAFNEPGTKFSSRTHVVNISKGILKSRRKEFRGAEPKRAITLGMHTIMSAKIVMLVAGGRKKADAIARSFGGKVSSKVPASVLQRHPNSHIILDRAAAVKLNI